MRDVYHCSPLELDKIPNERIEVDLAILGALNQREFIQSKRAEQKAKAQRMKC